MSEDIVTALLANQEIHDEVMLYEVATNGLNSLAEILEDLPRSSPEHETIKGQLRTQKYIIEKGQANHQLIKTLRDVICKNKDEYEKQIVLLEARVDTLSADCEKKDGIIDELQEALGDK